MTKRSDNLFLALLAAAVILLGFIIADNIMTCGNIRTSCPVPAALQPAEEKATPQGLPLHKAKYWKKSNE